MSRTRVHLTGYPKKHELVACWLKARHFGMILTLCPTVLRNYGKTWQERLGKGYLGSPRKRCQDFIARWIGMGRDVKSMQQNIFALFGYKIRIVTVQRWIMNQKHDKRPDDLHYWSVNW